MLRRRSCKKEARKQMTEDRRWKTEDRKEKIEVGKWKIKSEQLGWRMENKILFLKKNNTLVCDNYSFSVSIFYFLFSVFHLLPSIVSRKYGEFS